MPTRPATELTLTIVPPPFPARTGANTWETRSAPTTLVSYSCRAASSQTGSSNPAKAWPRIAALFTSRSTSPAWATACRTCAGWVTSSLSGTTRSGAPATRSASDSVRRAAAYTFAAPLASKAFTSARPIPRLAPVTSATRPLILIPSDITSSA